MDMNYKIEETIKTVWIADLRDVSMYHRVSGGFHTKVLEEIKVTRETKARYFYQTYDAYTGYEESSISKKSTKAYAVFTDLEKGKQWAREYLAEAVEHLII